MTIEYNKKIQDIMLMIISAICMLFFSYSYTALLIGFVAGFSIIATEQWYKNFIEKIITWFQKHRVINLTYISLVSLFLLLPCSGGLTFYHFIMILNVVMLLSIVGYGIWKNQRYFTVLITYLLLGTFAVVSFYGSNTNVAIGMFVLLLLTGAYMALKTLKK